MKPLKIKLFYRLRDCGDGSAAADFYRTEEACEKASEEDQENGGFAEDCSGSLEFEVDSETGEIIPWDVTKPWWTRPFKEDEDKV